MPEDQPKINLESCFKYLSVLQESLEVVDAVIFPKAYFFDRLQGIASMAKECERLIALKSN